MASSNGLISAPVVHEKTTGDIQVVINAVGTDDLETLCKWFGLNKWSKKKPISFAKSETLSEQNWKDANYGIIDIPTWTRLDYMATFLMSAARGSLASTYWPECDISKGSLSNEYYKHNKPSGGTSSPYRQTDFDNYWHDATQPVGNITSTAITISAAGVLQMRFPKARIDVSYQLQLGDLSWPGSSIYTFGNMYFGVLMQKTLGGATYASLMMSGGNYVKINDVGSAQYYVLEIQLTESQAWMAGDWKIYPIISSVTFPQLTTNLSQYNSNKFISPLPYHGTTVNIDIKYAEISITSHHGYKDSTSQQRYARFNFLLSNSEAAGQYRNYRIDLTICDSSGTQIGSYSGATTGQLQTGQTGSANISVYIASNWRTTMYYKATLSITDTGLKFKRESYVTLTGPIDEEAPTPD